MITPSCCPSRQPDAAIKPAEERRSYTTSRDTIVVAELYSDETFWEMLGNHRAQEGPQLVHKAFVLY